MPLNLKKELELYGSDCDPGEFNEILMELHHNLHPSWNVEQLLYRPDDEKQYCNSVRARAGKGLPDEMILRRLQNTRKAGSRPRSRKAPKRKKP